jgi:hypothetical protein
MVPKRNGSRQEMLTENEKERGLSKMVKRCPHNHGHLVVVFHHIQERRAATARFSSTFTSQVSIVSAPVYLPKFN